MDELTPARRLPAILGGLGGVLLLVLEASPRYGGGLPPLLAGEGLSEPRGLGWALVAAQIAATGLGLCLLRWWPYLLAVAGVLTVPDVMSELMPNTVDWPTAAYVLAEGRFPLLVIGVLAAAQSLFGAGATGWAAAIAGLALGSRVLGAAMVGAGWIGAPASLPLWHAVLLPIALAALVPALRHRPSVVPERSAWSRLRLVLTGVLAMCLVVPLSFLTTDRLAALLDVSWSAMYRHKYAAAAVVGAITVAAVLVLAMIAGRWALAGTVTAATVQVALVAPMLLAIAALFEDGTRWFAALAGVALGAGAAASRWRVPLAGALTVAGATAMFIAFAATTGHPEKIAEQRQTIPAALLLVVIAAAATAVTGSTAAALAPRRAVPAVLGPLTGVLAVGGLRTVEVTYVGDDGLPVSSYLNPVFHLNTSAVLLLAAGAGVAGLGLARKFADRRAERLRTEQIRREAAAAERDRLARPIHDGVLQVLALVQRHGSELGGTGPQLAEMAGEQEVALRSLLSGRSVTRTDDDLRAELMALVAPAVEVAAPAERVTLPAPAVAELVAAVRAALDNVHRHAGPDARAWVLLEDEGDGVRVTVRDDGAGFAPGRLAEAAGRGRLGVAQSMRGRVADLGGTTTIHSRPGEGTEVEFWVPRRRS